MYHFIELSLLAGYAVFMIFFVVSYKRNSRWMRVIGGIATCLLLSYFLIIFTRPFLYFSGPSYKARYNEVPILLEKIHGKQDQLRGLRKEQGAMPLIQEIASVPQHRHYHYHYFCKDVVVKFDFMESCNDIPVCSSTDFEDLKTYIDVSLPEEDNICIAIADLDRDDQSVDIWIKGDETLLTNISDDIFNMSYDPVASNVIDMVIHKVLYIFGKLTYYSYIGGYLKLILIFLFVITLALTISCKKR
jgi:hypothetical protein